MTEPVDPLDSRMAGLRDTPVPPLADAAAVRARGRARRRRQQALLACAAVLAAASLGGTVALVSGSSGEDALRTASPTATPSETAEPSETPTSPAPGPEPTTPPTTTAPAPPAPTTTSPAPPPPAVWSASAGFLSPEAASRAEEPGWMVEDEHPPRLDPGPVVDACDTDRYAAPPADSAERSMSSLRESGGSGLVQRVTRYENSAAATAVLDEIVAAFDRCPQAPSEDDGTFRYSVLDRQGSGTDRTALVRTEHCDTQECRSGYVSFVLLAQVDDGVSEAYYGVGEDATPQDWARALLTASADALRAAARG